MAPNVCHLQATSPYSSVEPPSCLSSSSISCGVFTSWVCKWVNDWVCVCVGRMMECLSLYIMCVYERRRGYCTLPFIERTRAKLNCCGTNPTAAFTSLLLTDRNTRWISSQMRLGQLLTNNFLSVMTLGQRTENVYKRFEWDGKSQT